MQQKLNWRSASPVRFPLRLCGILLLLLVITSCGICPPVAADSSGVPIRIGVLAHKGIDECKASWQPTIDYLNSAVPGYRFELVPLTFENISAATANHDIDFVLSNPGIFADLEVKYHASNILTLNNFRRGYFLKEFGGVIIARKDRQDIRTYNDLKGKRIIAAGKNSFGGWYSGFRELKSHGIDPSKDFSSLSFSESHPDAVLKVLNGEADAGIIRTDTLEQMEDEGKIKLADVYVFPPDTESISPDFPLLYSTRLYPEWAFAKLPQTDDTVASAVAVALLSVTPDSPAAKAAKMGRWTIPVNYESVNDCLKEIRAPPYENYGVITLEDMLRQYLYWMIAGVILFGALLVISFHLIMANRDLNTLRQNLEGDINKRKVAEEVLRETTEYLNNLFDYANAPIIVWDPEYVITRFNHAFEDLTLISEQEVLGQRLDILFPEDSRDTSLHEIKKTLEGERWETVEIPILVKDGSVRTVIWNSANILDNEGRIISTIAQGVDITERKAAEEALVVSEARYRLLADNSTDVIWTLDLSGAFTYISPSVFQLRGYTPEEVMHQSPEEVISKGSLAVVQKSIEQKLDDAKSGITPTPTVTEVEQPCRDGSSVWTEVVAQILCDATGRPTGFMGVSRDITERKQTQEALRESEEKYRRVVETAREGIIFLDSSARITFVNQQMASMLGYTMDEMLGQPFRSFLAEDQLPDHDAQMNIRAQGKDAVYERCFKRKTGGMHWALISARAITSPSGTLTGSFAMLADITERKAAEEALLQANKKLNLLSSITRHDINNQLTVQIGYLEILEDTPLDPSQNEYFMKVTTAAKRISAMIRFTKEYEAIGVQTPTWQDCRTLVDTAVKEAQLGKVLVKNDFPAGAEVFADPLVVKVFYNLMDNAVRYGGKITTIRFSALESGEDRVIVCEDDGDGVVADEKEKIFERGFGKNTGLGLALSREILSITGITIRETGEPGKGARFEMTVPKGAWRRNEMVRDGQVNNL